MVKKIIIIFLITLLILLNLKINVENFQIQDNINIIMSCDKKQFIGLIAIPLLIQTYGIFFIAYTAARSLNWSHRIAAPACLIVTSNFFELAVAVAISLFGLDSGAALATVVGVLVEVPVMLSLVYFVNRTKHIFEKI